MLVKGEVEYRTEDFKSSLATMEAAYELPGIKVSEKESIKIFFLGKGHSNIQSKCTEKIKDSVIYRKGSLLGFRLICEKSCQKQGRQKSQDGDAESNPGVRWNIRGGQRDARKQ